MEDSGAGAALERLVVFLGDEVGRGTTLSASIYCKVVVEWETDIHLTVSLTRTGIRDEQVDGCGHIPTCAVRTDFTFRDGKSAVLAFEYLSQCDCPLLEMDLRFSICPHAVPSYDKRRQDWAAENGFVEKTLASVGACSRLAALGIMFSADGNWKFPGEAVVDSWVRHFLETDFPKLGSWRNPSFAKLTLTALDHQSFESSRVDDAPASFANSGNIAAQLLVDYYKLTEAYCFSGDESALEFWTLTTTCPVRDHHLNHNECFPPHTDFVTTFLVVEQYIAGAWNAVNKTLVLRSTVPIRVHGLCREAMVNLVTNHTWLWRPKSGQHPFFRD